MSQQNSGQVIQPNNALRLKVGGSRLGTIDPAAIAKAEAALKSLASNFAQWLNDEIVKLETSRQTVRAQGVTTETMENLYLRAHDLKGLGTTYGYQLITRIAGSLCRLIDDKEKRATVPLELVDAHIDAIKAAVRDDIKSDEHPVGRVLVEELERVPKVLGQLVGGGGGVASHRQLEEPLVVGPDVVLTLMEREALRDHEPGPIGEHERDTKHPGGIAGREQCTMERTMQR